MRSKHTNAGITSITRFVRKARQLDSKRHGTIRIGIVSPQQWAHVAAPLEPLFYFRDNPIMCSQSRPPWSLCVIAYQYIGWPICVFLSLLWTNLPIHPLPQHCILQLSASDSKSISLPCNTQSAPPEDLNMLRQTLRNRPNPLQSALLSITKPRWPCPTSPTPILRPSSASACFRYPTRAQCTLPQ